MREGIKEVNKVKYGISKLSAGAFMIVLMVLISSLVIPTLAQGLTTVQSIEIAVQDIDFHDINISEEYSYPTGIRIKEVSGPDITHDGNMVIGTDYWIKNEVINKGNFIESVKEVVKIIDRSGNIVFEEETDNKTIDINSSEYFSKKWNTNNLSSGNYTIFVNATIEGFTDANPLDNNRTREVILDVETPPVATEGDVIISEIMYAPSSTWGGGQNEWVELYNNDSEAVNLLDWTIDDKSIPEVILQPKDHLIIARNDTKFSEYYFNVSSHIVKLTIGLKDSGEEILLNDSTGTVSNNFNYTDYANGGLGWGYKNNKTIWLNESGEWVEGLIDGGSPGAPNSISIPSDNNPPTIEFVDPTPTNGSELYLDSVHINVTLNETGSSATLNWNGVNETMNGSYINFHIDKIGLSDGIHTFKVYASDLNGNTGVSETRVITINSTTPNPPNIVINEFASSNETEWVELYNKGSTDINLSGWTMEDAGNNIKHLTGVISANGYEVFTYSNWLNNGGDVIFLNSTSDEVDYVGYGGYGDAPAPGAEESVGRFPNGVDTDNDSSDFMVFDMPTRGDQNAISIIPTYGVTLSQPADKTTIPGVNATYMILVTNKGDQNDSYTLSIKNHDSVDTAELSESFISLDASENTTLFLYVSDNDSGSYNVSINAISNTYHNATDEVTVKTNILPISIPSFVASNGICGSVLNASVSIRNDGDLKANITVVVSGLHQVTGYPIAGTGVVVNLGIAEEITLPVLVYLPPGADTGSYEIFADAWIEGDYPIVQKSITCKKEVVIVTH